MCVEVESSEATAGPGPESDVSNIFVWAVRRVGVCACVCMCVHIPQHVCGGSETTSVLQGETQTSAR